MSNCQKKCELNINFGLAAQLLKEQGKIKELNELNEEYKKQWNELDKKEGKL